jgi:replicative DNA helicase
VIDAEDVDPMPENENLFDGDPIPLTQSSQIPVFPVDMLPTPIANMVRAISEATQTDPAMAATSALSVLSASTGGHAEIQIRSGWQEPLNTYSVTILFPGERKSAVQRAMARPLNDVERQLTEEGRDARLAAETRKQVATKAAEKRRQTAATAMAKGQPGDSMADAIAAAIAADEIQVPPAPRLVADDITPEAAGSLLADQGGRLAIISAEGGIFGIIAGRYNNDKVNMDLWLKGHSGDELRVDRKGRPPEYVPRPALTVGLMIQPMVLSTIAANREFRGRGLLARFLYSCPAQMVGRRRIGVPVTPDIEKAYTAVVSVLAKGLAERVGCPAVLTLTESARAALEKIETEVEPTLAGDGELTALADWGAKYVGAIARIAGNLHLAEHGPVEGLRTEVTEKTILAAARIGAYFKACAINAFTEMGADRTTTDAVYLLDRIARLGQDEVSERDLFTIGSRARFKKKGDLIPVLQRLVDHSYLAPMPARPSGGRPPSPRYKVHPLAAKAAKRTKGTGAEGKCTLSAASAASAACHQPDADLPPDETAEGPAETADDVQQTLEHNGPALVHGSKCTKQESNDVRNGLCECCLDGEQAALPSSEAKADVHAWFDGLRDRLLPAQPGREGQQTCAPESAPQMPVSSSRQNPRIAKEHEAQGDPPECPSRTDGKTPNEEWKKVINAQPR